MTFDESENRKLFEFILTYFLMPSFRVLDYCLLIFQNALGLLNK